MGERKVGVIDDAHCLNEHGQNALLKTLEEPPGRSVLVLVATHPALVLPTVRSRCQVVRLEPLPVAAVARVLEAQGVAPASARELAPLGEGAPGRALALQGEDEAEARRRLLTALPELGRLPADQLSALAQHLARGPVDGPLAAATAWYRDALQTALCGEELPLRNPAAAEGVRAAAATRAPTLLLRQLAAVCDTIQDLGRNANRMLALETMLLTLRDLERGPRDDG
jgi:DNA polymerase-3 subunit delta'